MWLQQLQLSIVLTMIELHIQPGSNFWGQENRLGCKLNLGFMDVVVYVQYME